MMVTEDLRQPIQVSYLDTGRERIKTHEFHYSIPEVLDVLLGGYHARRHEREHPGAPPYRQPLGHGNLHEGEATGDNPAGVPQVVAVQAA